MGKEKKGFFASLKCNPQTAEEAKRKTNNTFIVIAIVCAAIAGLLCFLHYIFGLIAFVFSIPLVGFLYLDGRKKDKRNFCKECSLYLKIALLFLHFCKRHHYKLK